MIQWPERERKEIDSGKEGNCQIQCSQYSEPRPYSIFLWLLADV